MAGMNVSQLAEVAKLIEALQEIEASSGLHIESIGALEFELRDGEHDLIAKLEWVQDTKPEADGVHPCYVVTVER